MPELTTEMKKLAMETNTSIVLTKNASIDTVNSAFDTFIKQWKEDGLSELTSDELKDEVTSLKQLIKNYPEEATYHGYFLNLYQEALDQRK